MISRLEDLFFSKKHPNFDLSCKRRYLEHPKNPDPSKVAIFEDLYTPAILVQTLPLEGPCKFLGQFMCMYKMEYAEYY